MGQFTSKRKSPKINKNHNRQKVFKIGVSFGRNDLSVEGHFQLGYNSKTIKNYSPVRNELNTLMNKDNQTGVVVHNERDVNQTENVEE